MPNIELSQHLSTKYTFNDTSSDKFGMHEDLQNIDVIQLDPTYNMVNEANSQWYNSFKPRIYFIMQPEKNLESISNNFKTIFDELINRKMVKIQNNSMLLNKMNDKIPNMDFTRYNSTFPEKTSYIQHYNDGALLYAFTNPLLEVINGKLYVMLDHTTMMFLSFILNCRDYFKKVRYEDNITFGIAIKSSKHMILSHIKSEGEILSAVKRDWMRGNLQNCDYKNIYLKKILSMQNCQIMKF